MKNIFIVFLSVVLCACSKTTTKEINAPVITITNPLQGEEVAAGTLSLEGKIEDENKIIEVHVHLYSLETGHLLLDIHRNPNSASYHFKETIILEFAKSYKIQVLAKDIFGNQHSESVEISTR